MCFSATRKHKLLHHTCTHNNLLLVSTMSRSYLVITKCTPAHDILYSMKEWYFNFSFLSNTTHTQFNASLEISDNFFLGCEDYTFIR